MTPLALDIRTFCLGDWMTNGYILSVGKACWVIDPGFGPEPILEHIAACELTVERIVLTHAHVDHIAGIAQVKQAHPAASVTIHRDGAAALTDTALNLSVVLAEPVVAPEADETLEHSNTLNLGGLTFHIRHTPGHSPDGITLYQPDHRVAIVGDTLFAGSIGRYDFPNSNGPRLMQSIREQIMTLPDDTRVLSGHGSATTVKTERDTNPFAPQFLEYPRPDVVAG